MGAMLYFAISACMLITCASAEYSIKCNNHSESSMSFEPSTDGVKGRYTVLWCTEADENVTEWDLIIRYYETRKPEKCKHYDLKHPPPLGQAHSHIRQDVKISPNCTNACFSTSVDLIFQACYAIKSMILRGSHSSEGHDSFHYIKNNFTNVGSLRASTPAVKFVNYNDYVSAIWFLGSVPAANFTMDICSINGTLASEVCFDVTDNCTSALYDISCHLSPPHGFYNIRLVHFAPWVYGRIAVESAHSEFEHFGLPAAVPALGGGAWAWAWAWGALALCALAAAGSLCALLAGRARVQAKLRSSVRAAWLHSSESSNKACMNGGGAADGDGEVGARVLVVYARDCARAVAAARSLARLLHHVAPQRVYDLYSGEVCAMSGSAPGEWLRAFISRPDVRVVLLQTPAAACLYTAQLTQNGRALTLEQPLLGRVVAREPHSGDALLRLALRLLSEAAATPVTATAAIATDAAATDTAAHPYRKYYIASISGLEAEVVPLVTPQRRYLLPEAAITLLRDLGYQHQQLDQQLEQDLQQLDHDLRELLTYVAAHPDYLNDELLFL